ncbi:hypothetical protein SAMN05421770_11013 [Granulicella rosea]|uniref:Outer membrane protein beta-barrel domain-containing protein n=1 Tax=Granulicella rosea TaxID=474952 RepID=A0A239M5W2_9BACT|nr:hypothetical protein [Granulicella rosea]SNT37860.1 hypothetical protein SAMN05421770_11013 [Granulicella rosea]
MKLTFLATLLLSCAPLWRAQAQTSAYVDFTASKFTNLVDTNYLYGPTFGVSGHLVGTKRVALSYDVRGQILGTSQKYDSVAVGPRAQIHFKSFVPYGEFLIGFARYNDGAGHSSTDSEIDANAGVERTIKGPVSWRIFEYGYKEYFGLGGQFNPKSFSTGVAYAIGKR